MTLPAPHAQHRRARPDGTCPWCLSTPHHPAPNIEDHTRTAHQTQTEETP